MATKTKSKPIGSMQMTKQLYQQQASKYQPKRNVLLNSIRAFWVGSHMSVWANPAKYVHSLFRLYGKNGKQSDRGDAHFYLGFAYRVWGL